MTPMQLAAPAPASAPAAAHARRIAAALGRRLEVLKSAGYLAPPISHFARILASRTCACKPPSFPAPASTPAILRPRRNERAPHRTRSSFAHMVRRARLNRHGRASQRQGWAPPPSALKTRNRVARAAGDAIPSPVRLFTFLPVEHYLRRFSFDDSDGSKIKCVLWV
ncbi:hypothetical protein B0H15DRAFT_944275 [Mycena belliarum]|uniref:Uncharacterized protein n=1 Tax=Mycena belliarum TaxID=1033014 RepID=A0AAD6XWJ0_9AGAR|nr:hypothetical protein B0H15DRAFT_944275 [Mycena belliae]